ncbi:putative toxin-antitoxin system toxin component, PIN family [Nostoc sp.]|uniref:putative toxin-antitoxin system toxin component, PIN family n=1 Tax=Nostoc sp. TaxID=1180 RepID=UPI002FF5C234
MITNNRRFVFDTNVLISAFLFSQSKPRQALEQAQDIGVIVLSNSVLSELEEVLSRPKFDRYITIFGISIQWSSRVYCYRRR